MNKWQGIISTAASVVALVGAVGGAIWFLVKLDDRVSALETQVHTLTVAPTIVAAGRNSAEPHTGGRVPPGTSKS